MGIEEATALHQAERALEEAMTARKLQPGKAGWKAVAGKVTTRVLDSPHPDLPGNSRRTAILTERLGNWMSSAQGRSPDLHSLRSQFVKQLFEPVPGCRRTPPSGWRRSPGFSLTQSRESGSPRPVICPRLWCENVRRFDWDLGWSDRLPQKEIDSVELRETHGLVRRLGAVRRKGADLRTTRVGKDMLADGEVAWRRVAAGLSGGQWPTAVAEAYTLLLLDRVVLDRDIEERAAAADGRMGWRTDGHPRSASVVSSTWYDTCARWRRWAE